MWCATAFNNRSWGTLSNEALSYYPCRGLAVEGVDVAAALPTVPADQVAAARVGIYSRPVAALRELA